MKVTLCRDLTILFTMMLPMATHSSAADAILGEDEPVSDHEQDFVEAYPVVSQSYPPSLRPTFKKKPSLLPTIEPSKIVTKESPAAAPIVATTQQSTTTATTNTSKTTGLSTGESLDLIANGSPTMSPSPRTSSCNVVISICCFVEDAQGTKTNCKDIIPNHDDDCVKEVKYTYIVTKNGDHIENIIPLDRTRDGEVKDLSDFLDVHDTTLGHFGIVSETDTLDFCIPRIVTTRKSSCCTPCCFMHFDLRSNLISPVNLYRCWHSIRSFWS
jgi:hypothetical protein